MRRTTYRLALISLALLTLGYADDRAPVPADRPYVKLFNAIHEWQEATEINSLTGPELGRRLDDLTRWYFHFFGSISRAFPLGELSKGSGETTLAEKLARRGAMVSNYRHGSGITQANKVLAYRSSSTKTQYGCGFGLRKPDELFFWNWGEPKGKPEKLSELPTLACKTRSGGQLNIERRNYENGFVLVNPNKEAGECALGESFYDVSVADWDHPPRRVDRVEIGARDAAFLINVVRN